jgi:hypothetical protein
MPVPFEWRVAGLGHPQWGRIPRSGLVPEKVRSSRSGVAVVRDEFAGELLEEKTDVRDDAPRLR